MSNRTPTAAAATVRNTKPIQRIIASPSGSDLGVEQGDLFTVRTWPWSIALRSDSRPLAQLHHGEQRLVGRCRDAERTASPHDEPVECVDLCRLAALEILCGRRIDSPDSL